MQTPAAWETLKQFRLAAYGTLGHRKDSLFELLEAVLAAPGPGTLVRLSVATVFRRAWSSAPDALADGAVDADRCRELVQSTRIEPPPPGRPVWAVDGTVWPRPAAVTSPERTYGHRTTAGIPQDGVVPAWEYEWLVDVPAPGTGWVLPLDVRRRGLSEGTPTGVAISMLREALARRPADAPRPLAARDSGYDPDQLARAALPLDVLVRLRSNRVFYRAPGPYGGRGAPRKYGDVFRLAAPVTHEAPDASATLADPQCGQVQIDAWRHLRAKGAADAPCQTAGPPLAGLDRGRAASGSGRPLAHLPLAIHG